MKRFLPVLVLLLGVLLTSGCDHYRVFEKNLRIAGHQWDKTDTLVFYVTITDSSQLHDILINIRTGNRYQYSNLFLFVGIEAPSGREIHDIFEVVVTDNRGKAYGKGLGDIKALTAPFRKNIRFGLPGIYKFTIVQGMRTDVLPHVYDVGIRVQKSKT